MNPHLFEYFHWVDCKMMAGLVVGKDGLVKGNELFSWKSEQGIGPGVKKHGADFGRLTPRPWWYWLMRPDC